MVFYERASGAQCIPTISGWAASSSDSAAEASRIHLGRFCDPFLQVCDDLEGLLTEKPIFKQRNVGIGEVKLADAWGSGVFQGVMVRGSGALGTCVGHSLTNVIRELDFDIPVGKHGKCDDRYLVRMERCASRCAS